MRLSQPMRDVLRAMQGGVRYESEYWGIRRVTELPNAPMPTRPTMEALERRGLVAYKFPRRDGGYVSRWELTEEGVAYGA